MKKSISEINFLYDLNEAYFVLNKSTTYSTPEACVKRVHSVVNKFGLWSIYLLDGERKFRKKIEDTKKEFIFSTYEEALEESNKRFICKMYEEAKKDQKVLDKLVAKYDLDKEFVSELNYKISIQINKKV